MLKQPVLGCCKVYISESRNKAVVNSIEKAARLFHKVALINKFEDELYNRTGYTLVSKLPQNSSADSCALEGAVFSMIKAAMELIDFNKHCGSHPRLGVVDHVCFHPLGHASMDQVVAVAKSLAFNVGSKLEVPTFLYGSAHEQGRTLDSIRRDLGYFRPNAQGNLWAGGLNTKTLPLPPDEGPGIVDQSRGVVVIGATKWIDNYNVPVFSTNIPAIRRIAKRVSERGGGLASVQAMALAHGEGVVEVACNLLDPSKVGGARVQQEVARLTREEGMDVGEGYFTDLPQEKIIETYMNLGC